MKYWKALLPLLLLVMVAMLMPARTEAADTVQLYLNGKKLSPEIAPRIVNENTIVPLRIISEDLGAKVTWTPEGQRIKVEQGKTVIELQIDNPLVSLNGVTQKLETPPVNINGNTLVPVRFVTEQLGLKVSWDDITRTVSLYKQIEEAASTGNGDVADSTGPVKPDSTGQVKTDSTGTDGKGSNSKPSSTDGSTTSSGSASGTGGKPITETPGTDKPVTDKPVVTVPVDPSVLTFTKLELVGNEVVIQTTASVSPKISMYSNPDRIVIDLPGVTLAGMQLASLSPKGGEFAVKHPVIQKIRYAQYSDKPAVARIVLDLSQKMDYKLVEDQANKTIKIQPITKRFKVVIDAGHGGSDPGAISLNSRYEKEFTLALESKVVALLKQIPEIEVVETRSDDSYPTLQDRVDLANKGNANLFLSIHANKFSNNAVNGTETYYNRPDSQVFANLLHRKFLAVSGTADRGVRMGDLKVIRETKMPAVLIETGYLSNKGDEALLYSAEFQNRTSEAIAASIKEFLFGQ